MMARGREPMAVGMFENRVAAAYIIKAVLKTGLQEKQRGFLIQKNTTGGLI
jgi:hypothetical protein